MAIKTKTFSLATHKRNEFADITSEVEDFLASTGIKEGEAIIFCPHTTAAITINENADPDVVSDILQVLERILPQRGNYRHSEGNSDAHIKSSLVGCSEHILFSGGKLMLGTWQGIYFCEFDGPRSRKFTVQVRGE